MYNNTLANILRLLETNPYLTSQEIFTDGLLNKKDCRVEFYYDPKQFVQLSKRIGASKTGRRNSVGGKKIYFTLPIHGSHLHEVYRSFFLYRIT